MNQTKFRQLLLVAFALSGMTALIYEVVWTRPLQMIFGSTIYAVSTMLTTFFVGFALGSYMFRNLAEKNPIRLFALLEFGIGLYGLIILSLFDILPPIYLSIADIPSLQFLLIFLVLIIPTTMFGAIWPIVNKAYIREIGSDAGRLYAFNSFGAAFGSLAAGFLLIPFLGIRNTSLLAVSVNLLITVFIYNYSRKIK